MCEKFFRIFTNKEYTGVSIMITATNATAEIFWTAFRAMPKKERIAVVDKLLTDNEFMEDLIDISILKQRENEPSRSLDEYLADRNKS